MTYTVKWGDGTTDTYTDQSQFNVPLTHTYATSGTYAIHYSATDQDGSVTYPAQTSWGTPFRVRAANNPAPSFVSFFTDVGGAAVGDTVTFTATGSDLDGGDITSYAWNFGDGTAPQTSGANSATHAFTQPGTYEVRLTETDDDGGAATTYEYLYTVYPSASNNASGNLYAFDDYYYASFARTGQSIDFGAYTYNLPSGVTTTNYVFKWGDGTPNTSTVSQFASHTYATAGDYRAQVDISLSNGQTLHVQYYEFFSPDDDLYTAGTYTGSPLRVRGNWAPYYAYAYQTNNSGCLHAGQSISFGLYGYDADNGSIASFDVDWNSDGTYDQLNIPATDNTATLNHTYAAEGIYRITVRAKDNDGATYEDFHNVTQVEVTPDNCLPYASSTYHPDQPQTGKAITFDGSYSSDLDGSIASYQWDWDSNGTYDSTGVSPTHTYATDGQHHYTLKVTDNQGGVGYQQCYVYTHTGNDNPFFYGLYISQSTGDTNDTVYFNASGYDDDGEIVTYQWNWGDGDQLADELAVRGARLLDAGHVSPVGHARRRRRRDRQQHCDHDLHGRGDGGGAERAGDLDAGRAASGQHDLLHRTRLEPQRPDQPVHVALGRRHGRHGHDDAEHVARVHGGRQLQRDGDGPRRNQRDRHRPGADRRREGELAAEGALHRDAAVRDVGHDDDLRRLDDDRQRQRRERLSLGLRGRHDRGYGHADHDPLLQLERDLLRRADRVRRGGDVGPGRARDHDPGDELPAAGRVLHVHAEQPAVRQPDHVHRPRDRPGRLDRVLHVELGRRNARHARADLGRRLDAAHVRERGRLLRPGRRSRQPGRGGQVHRADHRRRRHDGADR